MPISNDAGLNEAFDLIEAIIKELSRLQGLVEPLPEHIKLCELMGKDCELHPLLHGAVVTDITINADDPVTVSEIDQVLADLEGDDGS